MKAFYKILDNGKAESGTTLKDKVPDGYIEFTLGEEPQELIEAKAFKTTDELIADAKEAKTKALDELIITHNTVAYDANGRAIGNMSAVMGVANFKYNQAISVCAIDMGGEPVLDGSGNKIYPDKEQVYNAIYKDTKIFWKGADNEKHEVMIESVCEALEKSMLMVSDILGL